LSVSNKPRKWAITFLTLIEPLRKPRKGKVDSAYKHISIENALRGISDGLSYAYLRFIVKKFTEIIHVKKHPRLPFHTSQLNSQEPNNRGKPAVSATN
jgi:hypothetical protein